MKTLTIVLFILFSISFCSAQNNNAGKILIGKTDIVQHSNGNTEIKTITNPEYAGFNDINQHEPQNNFLPSNSMTRWAYMDPIAIGSRNTVSGDGQLDLVGWDLNSERISLFNNSSATPIWEHPSNSNTNINDVVISSDGSYIVNGSYHNIYVFNNGSSTPVFDFNLETQLPDTGFAGPVDITSNGNFIVVCASRNDSSWIFGFNRTSTNWVWRYRVGQTGTGGATIQGIKMSGNDSLVLVNTYGGYYVFKTFTGQLMAQGLINPSGSGGTQFPQGISGNGSIIATINYNGFLRVYQWNGSTYNFLWQHQEPPGTFYNWMTAVDISYDGSLIACGTLNFVTSSTYDGKIKLFKTTNGSTPVWTYSGAGDEVGSIAFSKDGRILAAASYGDLSNASNDLLVFKTSTMTPAPIYGVNSPGSFFWVTVSDNGSTVIASGKRVHARTFGNGGELYNVLIDTNDAPLGINNNSLPAEFKLNQNYPNPFNPVTQITYEIPVEAFVKISLYDVTGREVKNLVEKNQRGGQYSITLDANDLSSGIYFYRINASGQDGKYFTDTKKLTLIK